MTVNELKSGTIYYRVRVLVGFEVVWEGARWESSEEAISNYQSAYKEYVQTDRGDVVTLEVVCGHSHSMEDLISKQDTLLKADIERAAKEGHRLSAEEAALPHLPPIG